jgi:dephospho-CoA kinase
MILGVTGCPGSGKSILAGILVEKGWILIDADRIGKEVVEQGTSMLTKLADIFGKDILNSDGKLNRRLLAQRAFSNPENTRLLNGVVHPELIRVIVNTIHQKKSAEVNIIVDCALIFEWGLERNFDRTICIRADEQLRKNRLMVRDGRSPEEIERMFASQLPEKEKVLKADIVLANNGTREELRAYGLMLNELPQLLKNRENYE